MGKRTHVYVVMHDLEPVAAFLEFADAQEMVSALISDGPSDRPQTTYAYTVPVLSYAMQGAGNEGD